MSSNKVVYRIIKFEGTPERVAEQLMKSVLDNIVCEMPGLTISVKDRNDDPNERGFFDSCRSVNDMITKGQALAFDEQEYLEETK